MSRAGRRPPADRLARRWDLTSEELDRVRAAEQDSYGVRELLAILIRSPSTAREAVRAMVRGAAEGAATNGSLVWVLNSHRVRQVIPDAASGVTWAQEEWFTDPLLSHLSSEMSVLDVGCGGGRISRHIAPRVKRLTCVDSSAVLLREASENLAHLGNIDFVHTDGYGFRPLRDGSFDVAYAQGVFSYLDPVAGLALLDETARALRPNGLSFINVFTIDRDVDGQAALEVARRDAARRRFSGHSPRPYAAAQVRRMHAVVGLDIVEELAFEDSDASRTVFVARRSADRP